MILLRRWKLWLMMAVLWMVLQDKYTHDYFVAGLIVGALVFWLTPAPELRVFRPRYRGFREFLRWLPKAVHLALYFTWELLKSNYAVALMVLNPKLKLTPGILAMKLRIRQPGQIAMVANMITLTPGTISLDVSPDNSILYIHCIDASDEEAALATCYRFEDLVMEVLE
ncbi:MAG: Na+/H+ antiporter subunit E [Bacillota bacterium]